MSAAFTPARSAINLRLAAFLLLVSSPFVWCAYAGVRYVLNGGVEDHGVYKKVDLKALGHFNFDQSSGEINDVPAIFRNLDGQRVMLEGYMFSAERAARANQFEFVYNILQCCFKGPPLVQERVYVHCAAGKSVPMRSDYVQIIGTLHVKVAKDEGTIKSVYTLDLESVQPVRR